MKLRRELVEELASWNVEHEPLSGTSAAKLSQSYFHLQGKQSRELVTGLPHCGEGFTWLSGTRGLHCPSETQVAGLGLWLLVLRWKVVEALGGGALLEEVGYWVTGYRP